MEKLSERMKVIKEKGHTVVVAEHRLAWIQKFADRIIYMKEGRIEQEFASDEFKALSDLKRKQMGLRSIVPEQIQIPEITGNSEDAVLQICNLSCKRKKQMIFQNISLSARAGDIIGITGKNGAGKSTFSKLVCGFETPDSGEILFQGRNLLQENILSAIACAVFLSPKAARFCIKGKSCRKRPGPNCSGWSCRKSIISCFQIV